MRRSHLRHAPAWGPASEPSRSHAPALVAAVWLFVCPAPPAGGQTIQKLPMLYSYRSGELWLQWETDSDPEGTEHVVEWGVASSGENQTPSATTIELDGSHFVHRAILSELTPATEYRYRIRSGASASSEFPRGSLRRVTRTWQAEST